MRSGVVAPAQSIPAALTRNRIDRLQLTTWALLRSQSPAIAGTRSRERRLARCKPGRR
jgi:hypothetical protein